MGGEPSYPGIPVRPGDLVAGKYRIESVIGSGGMGFVVAARHEQLDQRVAIKFVRDDALGNTEAVARFVHEARAVVKLKSEHVARVTDVGALASGAPYMVMELLEGNDLAAVLEASGPMTVQQAADLIMQACEALAEAHAAGIVHRDIKPHNLFLASSVGGALKVKVLDFGVSKALSLSGSAVGGLTQTRAMIGSPLYMSPEQMRSSRDVDARSDVWGLGVVLFELLSKATPFVADSMPELCLKVVADPPRSLAELRPDIPKEMVAVVERCLEKDPGRRYANAAELATALEPFVPAASQAIAERARLAVSSGSLPRPPLSRSSSGLLDTDSPTVVSQPGTPSAVPPEKVDAKRKAPTTGARRAAWGIGALATLVTLCLAAFLAFRGHHETAIAAPPPAPPPPVHPPLVRLHGSNTIGAELAPALAEAFLAKKTGAKTIVRHRTGADEVVVEARNGDALVDSIEVFAHGSGTAFEDLLSGKCDIGMASRRIKSDEAAKLAKFGNMESAASEHVIGLDGIVVIVNPSNPVVTLTKEQLASLFSGAVKNWQEVGGISQPVVVHARDDKSGTFDTFKHLVLKDKPLAGDAKRFEASDELSDAVAAEAGGVGFVGLPYVRSTKPVMVEEAGSVPSAPSPLTVSTEDYPLARRLYLYAPPAVSVVTREFVDFVLSEDGQKIVQASGFVDLRPQCNPARCANCSAQYRDAVKNACRLSVDFRFDRGSTELDNRGLRDLQRLVTLMGRPEFAGKAVLLFGFSDGKGSTAENLGLSQKRASLIGDQLRGRGLAVDGITGLGGQMPVADDSTEDGRQRNRRVEVWVR
jgi:phosphate transport system substrate-binding protein